MILIAHNEICSPKKNRNIALRITEWNNDFSYGVWNVYQDVNTMYAKLYKLYWL